MRREASSLGCLLPVACCLLAFGCNNGKQLHADLYRRELRLQEDEIYRLEDYIEQYQRMLREYRCEIAELKNELRTDDGAAAAPTAAPTPEFLPGAAPDRDTPTPAEDDPTVGEELDFMPAPDAGEAPAFGAAAVDRDRAGARLASLEAPRPETPASEPALLSTGDVDGLTVAMRAGEPTDGSATLVAAVTPLSEGEPAYFEGEASVLLADLPPDGALRRIARWDFTADEVEAAWADADAGGRLALPLLVPSEAVERIVTDRPMRIWVRLVNARGEKTLRSMEARFLIDPLRIVEPQPKVVAKPRRLPTPAPEAIALDADESPGWRRAVPGRLDRRGTDEAVVPASYESAADEQPVWTTPAPDPSR